MDNKERIETILTALETALDLLDKTTSFYISPSTNQEIRAKMQELQEYARYERQRMNAEQQSD